MALHAWDHLDTLRHPHRPPHHHKPFPEQPDAPDAPQESCDRAQTRYAFLFVPNSDKTTEHAPGAVLRLGEYSDFERGAHAEGMVEDIYPAQHIHDEGDEEAAYTQAAGGAEGILLACDGRILIRSGEKMYLETADYHQMTNGDYALDVDGTMTTTVSDAIELTSEDGSIQIKSGSKKSLKIKAGGDTGKLELSGKDHDRTIKGETTETFHGPVTRTFKDSSYVKKFGWDFSSIYGFNMDTYYGGKCESVYGLRMQFDKYNIISNWGCFNWVGTQVDLKAMVMKRVTAKFGSSNCTAEWNEIMVGLEHLKVGSNQVEARQRAVSLDSGQVDVKSGTAGVRVRSLSAYV
ncbi:hypothetical protein JM93_00103 [Roseibium hamelinense]|uniref:Uncharacterized protein n=1 Tax=Roseibium hamelinense TaxID=150831 RepID=A0A562TG69_9HYPH|nr:hypothetical protein [Roseibium hamelinense]MTI43092.1 hypothetical protein [Roseibium hamelinense]TWI92561.1 hypothetical protein JM93_00103 [Roseibium hamelinense]